MTKLLKLVTAFFGLIPGISVMISQLGVPPGVSSGLFGAVIETLGVATLLILILNRKWIKEMSIKKMNVLVGISLFLFLASFSLYLYLIGYVVIQLPNSDPLYRPFWPQGELKKSLESASSFEALTQLWGRDDMDRVIQETSKPALLTTTIILLSIYQLIFVSLTFVFGILTIKNSKASLLEIDD